MTQRTIWVEVRIPINISRDNAGLYYATSPLLRGLLVAKPTEHEIVDAVYDAVDNLGEAALADSETPSAVKSGG